MHVTHISSAPASLRGYLAELWAHRELVVMLGWRDLSLRFRHTAAGVAWLAMKPLLVLLALTFVFGKVGGFAAQSTEPYVVTVLSGLVPWMLFATALADVSMSVVNNHHIVTKTYFPRLALPLSALFPGMADLAVGVLFIVVALAWAGTGVSARLLVLPLLFALLLALALGAGLCLAAVNTLYRDVQHILPFALMLGMYLSPVGYRFANVPVDLQRWYNLNPLVGVIEGVRWALNPAYSSLHVNALTVSALMAAGLLALGLFVFRRIELRMADVL